MEIIKIRYIVITNRRISNKMSLKESNEIAVKIKCELETFYKTVEEKGFKIVDKFLMNDVYFIPNTLEIDKMKKTKK